LNTLQRKYWFCKKKMFSIVNRLSSVIFTYIWLFMSSLLPTETTFRTKYLKADGIVSRNRNFETNVWSYSSFTWEEILFKTFIKLSLRWLSWKIVLLSTEKAAGEKMIIYLLPSIRPSIISSVHSSFQRSFCRPSMLTF
jgi:uncharacterized membrane protein